MTAAVTNERRAQAQPGAREASWPRPTGLGLLDAPVLIGSSVEELRHTREEIESKAADARPDSTAT